MAESEQEPAENPYQSPRSSFRLDKPPIKRLGWIGYVLLSFAVVLIGFAAFWVCFATLCFGGYLVASVGEAGGPRLPEEVVWILIGVAVPIPFVVMLVVVRRLSKKWIRRQ